MVQSKKEMPVESTAAKDLSKKIEVNHASPQPEIESWMEKIEKKLARVPNQTKTPMDDQVVVTQDMSGQPPVTLPVSQSQMQAGKKAKTDEGIAWLVAWVIRKIKMLTLIGRKVRLMDLPEIKEP